MNTRTLGLNDEYTAKVESQTEFGRRREKEGADAKEGSQRSFDFGL